MDHSKISPNTYLVSTPEERIRDVYSFLGTYGTPDLPANLGYDFFADPVEPEILEFQTQDVITTSNLDEYEIIVNGGH